MITLEISLKRVIAIQSYEAESEIPAAVVDAIQKIIDSGSTLLITPTAIQNTLRQRLTGIEFGNPASQGVVKFINEKTNVALAPSIVSMGMRINSWDNVIYLSNAYSLQPLNRDRDINPRTPADRALANGLALRIDDINSKITIFDISEVLERVTLALHIWQQFTPVYAEIEYRVLEPV